MGRSRGSGGAHRGSAERAGLVSYCARSLGKYKVPRKLWFVDELPKDPVARSRSGCCGATLTARKRGSEKFEARRRARTYSPAGVRDIWEVYDCACPLEIEGAVATVTLDRPEARNALTPEMLCRLADAFATYEADDTLRALIITGAGEHAFCAGGDLASTIPLLTAQGRPSMTGIDACSKIRRDGYLGPARKTGGEAHYRGRQRRLHGGRVRIAAGD